MPSLRAAAPAAIAAAIVLLAGLLYAGGYREQYYALAEIWGAAPFRTPFLDMQGVTSPVECHRLGYDVYVQNPCDVFHRPHNYSPLWLWLAVLPITTAWDNALGLGLVVLFLVAMVFLPPGRDWRLITLATISSTTMFAMERANIDLLMFVMAMLVVRSALHWLRDCAACRHAEVLPDRAVGRRGARTRHGVPRGLDGGARRDRPLVRARRDRDPAGMANIDSNAPFDDNVFGAHNLPFGIAAMAGLPRSGAMAWKR